MLRVPDALVGCRGEKEGGAQERVLSAFLTEMDGVGICLEGLKVDLEDKKLVEGDSSNHDKEVCTTVLYCLSMRYLF